jgi:5-methylcytosine-specific restriction enzyme A
MDKLTIHLKDHVSGKLNGKSRSGHWHALRTEFLTEHPTCALCGGTKDLEVHHKAPFHTHPELELQKNNLITLCEANNFGVNCHLFIGHLGSFRAINSDIDLDIAHWAPRLRKHLTLLLETVGVMPISDPADHMGEL